MQRHSTIGAERLESLLRQFPGNRYLRRGVEMAGHHHEWWDGNGSPDGLKGEETPLSARILAVADAYDAMINKRCYKGPMSRKKSLAEILAGRGTHFDPEVVDAFLDSQRD